MKKRNLIILIVSLTIVVVGTGTGLGIYFWLNPLGSGNQQLEPGTTLLSGTFVEIDNSHWGRGPVNIVNLTDGSLQAQFVGVEIANGPDLYVYLSNKTTFTGIFDDEGGIVDLGLLPYNEGTFAVDIPGGIDLAEVKSVLIWCLQFTVVFTYASLS
jgi:hypothetical protein